MPHELRPDLVYALVDARLLETSLAPNGLTVYRSREKRAREAAIREALAALDRGPTSPGWEGQKRAIDVPEPISRSQCNLPDVMSD